MSTVLTALAALGLTAAIFFSGFWLGDEHAEGKHAKAELVQKAKNDKATKEQRDEFDLKGKTSAEELRTLNGQLSDARVKLARMGTGATCLSAPALSLLNSFGRLSSVRPAPFELASPPGTAASSTVLDTRVATDADVADAIVTCRAGYDKLGNQLNDILDIEDRRMHVQ